jgi:uncharacterized membrane protein
MFHSIFTFFTNKDRELRSDRWIFITVLITAFLGLIAAFVLSVEAVELLKNPSAQFSCSINAIINCATVGKTSYASLLGFPNSFIGMIGEPVFITVAIAGLYRVKLPRQFMFAIQAMAVFSLVYAFFLFHISAFIIQALCPWCLLVDVSTIVMFFAITRYNINENNLYLSKKLATRAKIFVQKDYDKFVAVLLVVIGIGIMIAKFGSALFA